MRLQNPVLLEVLVINPDNNSYSIGDALDFIRELPPLRLDGVATSPPYNKEMPIRCPARK